MIFIFMILILVTVSQAVLAEVQRIIEESEVIK